MAKESSNGGEFYDRHLRTFPSPEFAMDREESPFFGSLPELLAAFRSTTGYELNFIRREMTGAEGDVLAVLPVGLDAGHPVGWLILTNSPQLLPQVERDSARRLAESLAATLAETYRWSFALRQREAELAVIESGPVFPAPDAAESALRLRELLKMGACGVGCDAAALYLLNRETTMLKLRSVWGLPEERLTEPARPLAPALADLEALLGNLVILNEPYQIERWNAPESFATSLCVPVASDGALLGTLWFFSDGRRDFSARELAVLELTAGRLAVELERRALLAENRKFRRLAEQSDERLDPLSKIPPAASATMKPSEKPSEVRGSILGGRGGVSVFPVPEMTKESALFFLGVSGKKSRRLGVLHAKNPVNGPVDASISIPVNSPVDLPHPPTVANHFLPGILPTEGEKSSEEFLDLLRHAAEKKGRIKNLTLIVVKSPM